MNPSTFGTLSSRGSRKGEPTGLKPPHTSMRGLIPPSERGLVAA